MIEHNGTLPRELQAITIVEKILKRIRFPVNRVSLTVEFDYTMSDLTSHKVDVKPGANGMHGDALLRLNGLSLWQDPAVFYEECIPHEIAHVMDVISAKKMGEEIENLHGDSWRGWVARINSDLIPVPRPDGDFDFRPSKVFKGGIPVCCECEPQVGMRVCSSRASSRKRIMSGEEECSECGMPYEAMRIQDVPKLIADQVEFIRRASMNTK